MLEKVAEKVTSGLAGKTSRRSFLGRLGAGTVALVGGPMVATALRPERAEAHHICGHTFTTNSCPHPYGGASRIDKYGYPVHPVYGYPVDDKGDIYTTRSQRRRKICQERVPTAYPHTGQPKFGGGWSACCNGRIRRIYDCCSFSDTRINGDAAVTGYCYNGRKVFCVLYRDLRTFC